MLGEKRLRDWQDNLRNSGWRIQHVSWLPDGKVEAYGPRSTSAWLLLLSGFGCFFGGPLLLSQPGFPVWGGITIMLFGLVLLFFSRYASGRDLYGNFVPVDGICIDRDVREFIDPESVGDLVENTFWAARILCEFEYRNTPYRVTPIIAKISAFRTEEEAHRYLDQRMDEAGHCKLWVAPNNPLHTIFHQKPKAGPYTV
jgi:hypothetical protein